MKLSLAILFLAGAFILTSRWQPIRQAGRINNAYIFLTRAIEKLDESAASGFNDWSWKNSYSIRERDASAYGLAMLFAHQASNSAEDWLQGWDKGGCRLTTDPLRNEMIESKVTMSLAPADLLAMIDCLDDQTTTQWLISAAEKRPIDALVFLGEIERKGLVSGLSQVDRIRLAAVYGNLADQMRRSGSSSEEVMALVDKSLALDPQSEMALIQKALMLRKSGQLVEGIALLEKVTALYPDSYFAWECLAALRIDNADYTRAESAARTSIGSQTTGGSWGTNLLAIALLKQERCAEALPYAQAGVRNHPELPYDLVILGDVYWCLGEKEQASSVYQHLEAIDPDYAPYVHARIQSTK